LFCACKNTTFFGTDNEKSSKNEIFLFLKFFFIDFQIYMFLLLQLKQ